MEDENTEACFAERLDEIIEPSGTIVDELDELEWSRPPSQKY